MSAAVRTRIALLILALSAGPLVMVARAQADVLLGYCCVCSGCSGPLSVRCEVVEAKGATSVDCAARCTGLNCSSSNLEDGICALHGAECAPPAAAPAASHGALLGLASALLSWGVYRARRRRLQPDA